jgi:predicted enzyme related to lactoylglutathione lyase
MEVVEVVVYTRDMARATSFYRDVLGLEPDFESEHWTAGLRVFDARDPDGNRFSIESRAAG